VPACLAGVMAGHVYMCCVADWQVTLCDHIWQSFVVLKWVSDEEKYIVFDF